MGRWPDSLSSGWGSGSSSGGSGGSGSEEEGEWSEWRFLRPRSPLAAPPADISFELVEGDFAVSARRPCNQVTPFSPLPSNQERMACGLPGVARG